MNKTLAVCCFTAEVVFIWVSHGTSSKVLLSFSMAVALCGFSFTPLGCINCTIVLWQTSFLLNLLSLWIFLETLYSLAWRRNKQSVNSMTKHNHHDGRAVYQLILSSRLTLYKFMALKRCYTLQLYKLITGRAVVSQAHLFFSNILTFMLTTYNICNVL